MSFQVFELMPEVLGFISWVMVLGFSLLFLGLFCSPFLMCLGVFLKVKEGASNSSI